MQMHSSSVVTVKALTDTWLSVSSSLSVFSRLSLACRHGKAVNVSDYTLMVSYVLSFQYYAVFRCTNDNSSDGRLLDLSDAGELKACLTSILDTAKISRFIDSVQTVLTATEGETHPDLADLGVEMINQSAQSPWIRDLTSDAEARSDFLRWIDRSLGNAETKGDFLRGQAASEAELIMEQLKVWFAFKLKGEQQRHTVGHHMSHYDEVFNETDRIVAILSLRCHTSVHAVPGMYLCRLHNSILQCHCECLRLPAFTSPSPVEVLQLCIAQFYKSASWGKQSMASKAAQLVW